MKKLTIALVTLVALLGCLFALTACGGAALQMDTRYIIEDSVNQDGEPERYLEFHKNGTGELAINTNSWGRSHYIIHFKWTYIDSDESGVVCFFDKIEFLEDNENHWDDSDWSLVLTVSKNVLMTTGGYFYINEGYLGEIPNFNK